MKTSEIITFALAVWGAVLSTSLAILTFLRERREDGRLRIRVWVGKTTSSSTGIQAHCSFEVVNVGRRPVYFGGLILHDSSGKFIDQVLGPLEEGDFEKLEPGEMTENIIPGEAYEDMGRILRTRKVFAIDPRRRRTYMPRWRVWDMRRRVLKIQAEHQELMRRRALESASQDAGTGEQ